EVTDAPRQLPLQHPQRFSVYRQGKLRLAAGDLVAVTANGSTLDARHRLNNGDVFQVKGFTPAGDIELTNGWTISKGFGHLGHGYLSTSHGSQGRTVDRVLVVQSAVSAPATNRTQAYVSASRGREMALVLTDRKDELLKASERDDSRTTASEFVRRRTTWRQRMQGHVLRLRRQLGRERPRVPMSERIRELEASR